jgi:hypothetical protein
MKDGVIYYPKEIYESLGIKPFALPPPLTPASQPADAAKSTAAQSAFSLGRKAFGADGADGDEGD